MVLAILFCRALTTPILGHWHAAKAVHRILAVEYLSDDAAAVEDRVERLSCTNKLLAAHKVDKGKAN